MRIDEAGQPFTITELLAGFADRPWLYEVADLPEKATVRLFPGGLTTGEPVETGDGPYVVVVDGDLVAADHVERACIGQHGDRDGVLDVYGELSVPILLLDSYTVAAARGGIRALIYSAGTFWEDLQPDIADAREGQDGRHFRPELLDRYGDLDLNKAISAVRAGVALLLPGVEESHPDRLRTRPAG